MSFGETLLRFIRAWCIGSLVLKDMMGGAMYEYRGILRKVKSSGHHFWPHFSQNSLVFIHCVV
jgi:hypothetical protein